MNMKEFRNPGKEYRPSPFWSWNDALDPEELCWQVREFADKGFGGYFMHSRVGLATAYLSEEWMKCIKACLKEGKKVGTESWLYDEDKWPSGFAGGFVPAKSDEYRSKFVSYKEIKAEEVAKVLKDPSLLGLYEIEFSSLTTIESFKRAKKKTDVKGDKRLFMFKVQTVERDNWFNGESYVDLLNPEVTEEFLKVTHDAYAKKFGKDFGEYMPGMFTDEPNYIRGNAFPWTEGFDYYFLRHNNYDVFEKLPLLLYDGKGCKKVRYDFWRTVTLRFVEAWTIPYAERCEKLGLMMTGHYLSEDTLDSQIRVIGAAMPHYEYQQLPGIDHLGRNIRDPLTLKQCSSVSHQFGRTRVLSEIFGTSGQCMTFEDQKWMGDFHLALGITFFCPHLTLYTMKGEAKRDWPPTNSYHQPYWENYRLVNDYHSRGGYLCSQGKFNADIILLHSIGSAWATFTPIVEGHETPVWKYHNALVKLQDDLLALHRDFDYGDEIILSRHGHVRGKEFIVKEGRYRIVVVPPSLTWAKTTIKLLTKFMNAGGKVLFVGETPTMIDSCSCSVCSRKIKAVLTHPNAVKVSAEKEDIAQALDKILPRAVSVADEKDEEISDILVHHRVVGKRHIYFFANTSRTNSYDASIELSEIGEAAEWDLYTGDVASVDASTSQGKTIIKTRFYPTGSHAFVVDATRLAAKKTFPSVAKAEEKVTKLSVEWSFNRLHPNSLTLDTCKYSLEGGGWTECMPVWKARREIWKDTGLGNYIGIQPWTLIQKKIKPKKTYKLQIKTKFLSEVKDRKVFLVVENAPLWKLTVNGKIFSTYVKEWHWDKQFGKIDISKAVKIGENVVELSCQFNIDTPIEDVYLVGEFGVKKLSDTEYTLTDEPKTLKNGDWVKQGYPFYAGTMRYKATFNLEENPKDGERILIRLPEAKGTLFQVKVNRKGPVPIVWRPLEADVTDYVQKGKNELTVEVISSLRNTFGPLHNKLATPYFPLHYLVGPFSFTDEHNWTDAYIHVPYGLINGAEMVIRKQD
jgi:hypothetical protein